MPKAKPFASLEEATNPRGKSRDNGLALVSIQEMPALRECLYAGMLCNDSALIEEGGALEHWRDPTEGAMIVSAEKAGLRHADIHRPRPGWI